MNYLIVALGLTRGSKIEGPGSYKRTWLALSRYLLPTRKKEARLGRRRRETWDSEKTDLI